MLTTQRVLVLTTLALTLGACGQQAARPGATATAGVVRQAATDYTSGVTVSGSTATIWFKSAVNTSWVDVHYSLNGGGLQNLRMTYNGATARYEQSVPVANGNTLSYSFTYNNGALAYDTPSASYTVGNSGLACFYADANFQGDSFCAGADSGWVGAAWNDRISSLKVQNGYQVQLFNDINYGGVSKTFSGDTAYVGNDFNDLASSFKIVKTGSSGGAIGSIPASSIPAPSGSGVMALKVMNGTNGAYADNQIYWGVLGINPANNRWSYLDLGGNLQPISAGLNDAPGHLSKNGVNYANIYHTVADAAWTSLPQLVSGRMFVCVGTPCFIKTFDSGFAGPDINNAGDPNRDVYFDFIEFTVNGSGYHGNTTRVDAFGFPLEHRLVNRAGTYDRTVGEPESETRAGLFSAFKAQIPGEFTHLATVQAPYRIVAPIHGDFRAGGPQGHYFDNYVNQVWNTTSTKPSTQEVLLCNGVLAQNAAGCAALNRHVYQNPSAWNTPSQYYLSGPANYYAQFWHQHALGGLAYGFAYDDVNQQAAYLEVGDPKGLIIRVGW